MHQVIRNIGLGVALSYCLGAIAACQSVSETANSPATNPETTSPESTESAPSSQPQTGESTGSSEDTASVPSSVTAAEPKPIPPLPEGCDEPQTQKDINRCTQAEYNQADVRLNNAYQAVKASVGGPRETQLVAAEQAWIEYRDANCDFVQAQYEGGSIQPAAYYGCMMQLTDARTAELKQTENTSMSYDAADKELNSVYQELQDYLSSTEQELLTDAQLEWIEYRDAHCAFEDEETDECLAQVTETRLEQLQEQLESRSL